MAEKSEEKRREEGSREVPPSPPLASRSQAEKSPPSFSGRRADDDEDDGRISAQHVINCAHEKGRRRDKEEGREEREEALTQIFHNPSSFSLFLLFCPSSPSTFLRCQARASSLPRFPSHFQRGSHPSKEEEEEEAGASNICIVLKMTLLLRVFVPLLQAVPLFFLFVPGGGPDLRRRKTRRRRKRKRRGRDFETRRNFRPFRRRPSVLLRPFLLPLLG